MTSGERPLDPRIEVFNSYLMAIHHSFPSAPPIVTDLICDYLLYFETWSGNAANLTPGVTHIFDFLPSLLDDLILAGNKIFHCLSRYQDDLQGIYCVSFQENKLVVKYEGSIMRLVKFSPQTTELTFVRSFVPDLSYLPFLRSLSFESTCIFDHTRLDNLYALQQLSLRDVKLGDWSFLRFPAGLTRLSFDDCDFNADLSYLPNLEHLRFRGNAGQDWSKVLFPSTIITLFLCLTDYTADLSHLTSCRELQMNITETDFTKFQFPPNLRKLQMVQSPYCEDAEVSHLKYLQYLRIEGNCVRVRDWNNVRFPLNLEVLQLDGTTFDANISYLEHLQSISLHGVPFVDFDEWKKCNLPTYLQKHPESITIANAANSEDELEDKQPEGEPGEAA